MQYEELKKLLNELWPETKPRSTSTDQKEAVTKSVHMCGRNDVYINFENGKASVLSLGRNSATSEVTWHLWSI